MAMSSDAARPISDAPLAARPAIRARGIGKAYKIYGQNSDLLREVLSGRARHREHWALRDVDFDVARGSVTGIIGANGSGKSTLLKIVAGLLDATTGTVEVDGKISAILELGTGFHPDFTGRENIITGGMCLGMTRGQIEAKAPWIIEFSELASVMDQPFRTYSSGMQARLTFSTAVSIDPDILIIDEALAAGDSYFVAKCFRRIREICASGATVLFVSHGTNQVASLCNQAIWLEDGRVKEIGPAREVTKHYDYAQHVRISRNVGQIVEIDAPKPLPGDRLAAARTEAAPTAPEAATPASNAPVVAVEAAPATRAAATGSPRVSELAAFALPRAPAPALMTSPAPQAVASPPASDIAPAPVVANNGEPGTTAAASDSNTTVKIYRRGPIVIDDVVFCDEHGKPTTIFRTWDTMRITVRYHCEGDLPAETLGLAIGFIRERDHLLVAQINTNNRVGDETFTYDEAPFRRRPGRKGTISATFPRFQMLEGDYMVSVGVMPNIENEVAFYEYHHRIYRIRIVPAGYPSGASFYPLVEWRHEPGAS